MNGLSSAYNSSLNNQRHRTGALKQLCFHRGLEKPTTKSTSAPVQVLIENPEKQTHGN